MSLTIAALDEIRLELGITDNTDDAALLQKAEGLQGRFDEHLGRTLARGVAVEETFDGGVTWLLLARFPVEAVTAVYIDDELQDTDDYRLNPGRGRLAWDGGIYGDDKWPAGMQNIRVVYNGGYVARGTPVVAGQNAMPEAIRRAFLMQIGFEWRNRMTMGAESISTQGGSVSLAPAKFLPEVEAGLAAWRRI